MVGVQLERFIASVHGARAAAGTEELVRGLGMTSRTLYRLHRTHAGLVYFPSLSYESLGLVHVHAFVDDASSPLSRYAVRAVWLVRNPGVRVLYLHCLVPAGHQELLRQVSCVIGGDGWQALSPDETLPPLFRVSAWDVVERYPLLIPVIFECVEQRRSMPELWRAIFERLGNRVWQYLPRFSRRLPHNGKAYVRDAFRLVNEAGLFRQHVVRAVRPGTVDLLLISSAPAKDVLSLLSSDVQVVEVFPAGDVTLAFVQGTIGMINRLFTARPALRIREVLFVDPNESVLPVRFAYEQLFDPSTCEWMLPDDP